MAHRDLPGEKIYAIGVVALLIIFIGAITGLTFNNAIGGTLIGCVCAVLVGVLMHWYFKSKNKDPWK